MKKSLKMVFAIFAVITVSAAATLGLVLSDVAGSLATDSKPLLNGAPIGKALIVYDPGLSGGAKDVATKIGYVLQSSGYDVVLAGVKSSAAANISDYDVIVVGGPIYAGKPAGSIQSYIDSLMPPTQAKVAAFGFGSVRIDNNDTGLVAQEVAPLPSGSSVTFSAVIKIISQDNVDALCAEFVSTLLDNHAP